MKTFHKFTRFLIAGLMLMPGGSAAAGAQSNEVTNRYLISVPTELMGRLDARSAVLGTQVVVKTKQNLKLADGREIPEGTRLVGHVLGVRSRSEVNAVSLLAVTFDRAEVKGSQPIAVRCVIMDIGSQRPGSGGQNAVMLAPGGGGAVRGGSGGDGMGGEAGGLGGVGGAGVGSGAETAGSRGKSGGRMGGTAADTTVGNSLPTAITGSTEGGPTAKAGETVGTAPRATGLPGVLLSTPKTGNGSGMFIDSGRDVNLPNGTPILMGVIGR